MAENLNFPWCENRPKRHIEKGTDERLFKAETITTMHVDLSSKGKQSCF